jgi:hypothetical protein
MLVDDALFNYWLTQENAYGEVKAREKFGGQVLNFVQNSRPDPYAYGLDATSNQCL